MMKIDTKKKMKAVVHKKYGPPSFLTIEEVNRPKPKKDQILIKIYATTVTPSDILLRSGKFPIMFWIPVRLMHGLFRPRSKILGYELSGKVEAVGPEVSKFKPGDEVIGGTYWKMSTSAEYICLSEKAKLALKPQNMNFNEAAGIPDGSTTALHFLKLAQIKEGDKVLIYGASGSVGTYAVQLAKYFRAEVTGICSSSNFELVQALGADSLIDYKKSNYGDMLDTFDVVFDAVGRSSYNQAKNSLVEGGIFVTVNFSLRTLIRSKWLSWRGKKYLKTGFSTGDPENLKFLCELVAKEEIKPVIDRYYSMEQISEAHDYVSKGHKKGNVIITIQN